jgi:SAM-dependent methyltransferase
MNIVTFLKRIRIILMNAYREGKERLGFLKRKIVKPKLPQNSDGKVYVNLGCGVNTSKEFINVDTRGFPHTHYIHEVEKLSMFADDSVDLLYASHLLEHISRSKITDTLQEWKRVLKKGGVLRFGVPDFDGLIAIYKATDNDVESIMSPLMGGEGEYDDHHTAWNFSYAEKLLHDVGFKEVRKWAPEDVEHHDFVDKTTRVYEKGDNKIAISLNIEAVK